MERTNPDRCTCVINIIARITCIYSSWEIHSMSATSSHRSEAATHSVIVLTWILIILWRRGWLIVLMNSRRILSSTAIFVAMTDDLLSLIVESWVLGCRIVVKSVWSKQNLISTLIVILSGWPSIPSSSTSCGNPWLRSLWLLIPLWILIMNRCSLISRRWASLRIFALWTANILLIMRGGICSLRVVTRVLRAWATILSAVISSISTTKPLLLLLVRIKILARASIIGHIECILNTWRPLSLSIPHGEMRISVSKLGISPLVTPMVIMLAGIILIFSFSLPRGASSPQSCLIRVSVLFSLAGISRRLVINFRLFGINRRLTICSWSTLLLFVNFLMEVHLILESGLHMVVFIGVVYHSCRFRYKAFICISWMNMCSLRPVWRGQARHPCSPLMTVPIWVRSVLHPRLLMSFGWWTVAHDNTAIFLTAYNTILSVVNVLVFILRDRSIQGPRSVVTFFIKLLLDWFNLVKLVSLSLIVLVVNSSVRVLGVGISMVVASFVAINLCLSRGTRIWHGDIVGARTSIP